MPDRLSLDQKRILAAEAAALPPEQVAQWLEKMPPADRSIFGDWKFPHEIVLLRRRHVLIDLAIAKYASDARVIRRVYERGNTGVRCAALKNRTVGPRMSEFLSRGWMSHDTFKAFTMHGTKAELYALYTNEFLDSDVLEILFKRDDVFSEITEARWQQIILFVADNPRLRKEYDGPMNGWAEYKHGAFVQDAWKLSVNVPITPIWAYVLEHLYRKLPSERCFTYRWIKPALERWRDNPEDQKPQLGSRFWVRSWIADCERKREDCRDSVDLAVRLSYYRSFSPNDAEELQAFYQKDGPNFLDAALDNERIFADEESRQKLHDPCWDHDKEEKDLLYANMFNTTLKRIKKMQPSLVKDDADKGSEEMQVIAVLREEINHKLSEIYDMINQLSSARRRWW